MSFGARQKHRDLTSAWAALLALVMGACTNHLTAAPKPTPSQTPAAPQASKPAPVSAPSSTPTAAAPAKPFRFSAHGATITVTDGSAGESSTLQFTRSFDVEVQDSHSTHLTAQIPVPVHQHLDAHNGKLEISVPIDLAAGTDNNGDLTCSAEIYSSDLESTDISDVSPCALAWNGRSATLRFEARPEIRCDGSFACDGTYLHSIVIIRLDRAQEHVGTLELHLDPTLTDLTINTVSVSGLAAEQTDGKYPELKSMTDGRARPFVELTEKLPASDSLQISFSPPSLDCADLFHSTRAPEFSALVTTEDAQHHNAQLELKGTALECDRQSGKVRLWLRATGAGPGAGEEIQSIQLVHFGPHEDAQTLFMTLAPTL